MGLLSIIRKIKRKEKEMRILMVGLDNSGKTTIVLRINGEDTSVISPTLGFNIKTINYDKYTLNIWDIGGQKTIRSYWRNYFEQTDGLVWVVDSSDVRRLDDCKFELHNILKEERLSGATLLILANKQDIQGALTPAEIAEQRLLRKCLQLGGGMDTEIQGGCDFRFLSTTVEPKHESAEPALDSEVLNAFRLTNLVPCLLGEDIFPNTRIRMLMKVLDLDAMDKTRHTKIVGCSAYTGEGLLEGFDWLVQDIASRIYVLD